jgi:hypothetical protein
MNVARPTSLFDAIEEDFFGGSMLGGFGNVSRRMGRMMEEFERGFENDFGSSHSRGNNGRAFYSSTTTMSSANGVTETTHAVADSRSGTQKVEVKRSLGDKTHVVTKVRDREGREQTVKRLQNITDDDEETFDREWNNASTHLPSWGRRNTTHGRSLTDNIGTTGSRVRPIAIEDRRRS